MESCVQIILDMDTCQFVKETNTTHGEILWPFFIVIRNGYYYGNKKKRKWKKTQINVLSFFAF